MAFFVAATVCFAALAIVRPAEIGSIQKGIDTCAACGMVIEDSGFAGARVVVKDGRESILYYDDLGCLLDAAREKDAVTARRTFVQDSADGEWVRGEDAWFVMDTRNRTPMGSGILAFRDKRSDGMRFDEIAKQRREYMRAKYGGE